MNYRSLKKNSKYSSFHFFQLSLCKITFNTFRKNIFNNFEPFELQNPFKKVFKYLNEKRQNVLLLYERFFISKE